MRGLIAELRRRRVDRVAIAYLAASWLLVQILETLLPVFGVGDEVLRWVILALGVGFVPALAGAWIFQWSPSGVRPQAEIDGAQAGQGAPSRTADRVIIAVLTLAVLFFAADKFLWNTGSSAPTIAVLPFDDLTATQDQGYFADGLAEELLNLLAQNGALQVAARTSSFRFRGANLSVEEIGKQLGVAHVLEGSVRRDGERIRVTAQLIEAESGFHLWSQTYDEAFGDIFSIQDRMSEQIAEALQATVLGEPVRARRTDPEAYALFLRAKYLAQRGTERDRNEAIELSKQALAIDAEYPAGWSELASIYINQASNHVIDYDEGFDLAQQAALRSVAIDPRHADGYDRLAWIAFWYQADIGAAVEFAKRAIEGARQDIDELSSVAMLLQALGKLDEALALQEYAVARSPIDPIAAYNIALTYKYAHRLEAAERAFGRVLQLSPEYSNALYHRAETLLLMGRAQEALDIWAIEADEAYRAKGRALAYFSLADRERSDEWLATLIEGWGEQWPSEVAHVYAWRGERDAAFEWLERDLAVAGAGGWGEWRLQPLYANLHDDPRWQAFLERVGASDRQLARYDLEVELPRGFIWSRL